MPRQNPPIAIAFSDHHYCNWKQFNKDGYRLKVADDILNNIIDHANQLEVPILFCGDLVDHPKHVENVVLGYLSKTLPKVKTGMFGINGNHDQPKVNTYNNPVEGYFNHFTQLGRIDEIRCVDNHHDNINHDTAVHGIPYIFGNVDFVEALEDRVKALKNSGCKRNILLLHRDMEGALEPSGKRIDKEQGEDTEILKELFSHFDLVLCGHIHKPQQLTKFGDHVYMLGATHQQRRSDMGCEMGYWIVYKNFELQFVPTNAPQFRYYTDEPLNDTDFWIKAPEKIAENEVKKGSFSIENVSKEKLIKNYLIVKNQKSKRKLKLAIKYL